MLGLGTCSYNILPDTRGVFDKLNLIDTKVVVASRVKVGYIVIIAVVSVAFSTSDTPA